jgi:putative ABC transport system permease protein
MLRIALAMLVRDKSRYFGIVLGVTLSAMIITQQASIFCGLMSRTIGFLSDTSQPDIWAVDPKVQFIDDIKPLQDTSLWRVRGVEGVAWALPLYKGTLRARLSNGTFQSCNVIGLDDTTLMGGPPEIIKGSLSDLRRADSVIVDEVGANSKLARINSDGSKSPLQVGDTLELNDRRAIVVGIARVTRTFQSQPVLYTTYTRATTFAPQERRLLSFIMVKAKEGTPIETLAGRIKEQTKLNAHTTAGFKELTIRYFLKNTGIPINFGIAIILGFVIGTAIAGQTFYSFTLENLRYFAALKAMGARLGTLLSMVVLQATVVGTIGYGLGVGIASSFFYLSRNSELAFYLPWQLLTVTGVAVTIICILAALLSVWKVARVEPAVVFRS